MQTDRSTWKSLLQKSRAQSVLVTEDNSAPIAGYEPHKYIIEGPEVGLNCIFSKSNKLNEGKTASGLTSFSKQPILWASKCSCEVT